MSALPTVAAVMLVDGRQAMVDRAVRSFLAQTYERADLLVLDTSPAPLTFPLDERIAVVRTNRRDGDTIGSLRNLANEAARNAHILCHWDSDDYSHPARIAEQVARMGQVHTEAVHTEQVTEVTGYNDLLFWEQTRKEAWKYKGSPRYSPGAALMYWRETWKRKPFELTNSGEDNRFISGLRGVYVSSISDPADPRMVCGVHPGNTTTKILYPVIEWKRVPDFDAVCKAAME